MAQLTVPIAFDHDDLQRMVDEKIAEVKAQFIPKADYETRLKADLVAMLTELKADIYIMSDTVVENRTVTITSWKGMQKRICKLIQSKIDKLKENENGDK